MLIIIGWKSLNSVAPFKPKILPFISVVIPVKDELRHIPEIIDDFSKQRYPLDKFELVFIDDQSSDGTYEEVLKFKNQSNLEISIYHNPPVVQGISSKKMGLTLGVNSARGSLICFTDGDTGRGPDYIRNFALAFNDEIVQFVSGPVVFNSTGTFFQDLASIEFSSLMATGAAGIALGVPVLCNGANIAFRKSAFNEVGGFEGAEGLVSGDDLVLMHKIYREYPKGLYFLKSEESIVYTDPPQTLGNFANQRIRWAGKWSRININVTGLSLFVFFIHLTFVFSIIFAGLNWIDPIILLAFFLVKMWFEYILFKIIFKFTRNSLKLVPFIVSSLLYSFYAITFGLLANVWSYKWKGKTYNN